MKHLKHAAWMFSLFLLLSIALLYPPPLEASYDAAIEVTLSSSDLAKVAKIADFELGSGAELVQVFEYRTFKDEPKIYCLYLMRSDRQEATVYVRKGDFEFLGGMEGAQFIKSPWHRRSDG